MYLRTFSVFFILALLTVTATKAQECIDYDDYLHLIDTYVTDDWDDYYQGPKDIVDDGDNFFMASGETGLVTGRIDNNQEIEILSTTPTWDSAEALVLFENRLYIADGLAGLQVYDVRHPHDPHWLAHIDTPGHALDVEVTYNRAFLLDSGMGLVVINTSEVKSPRIIASLPLPSTPISMTRQGDLLLIACGSNKLVVVVVANPDNPEILNVFDLPYSLTDLSLRGDLLAIADQSKTVHFLGFSSPLELFDLGSIDLGDSISSVKIFEDLALVGTHYNGFAIVNIQEPWLPFVQARYNGSPFIYNALSVMGDYFIAVGGGMDVLDFSNPISAPLFNKVPLAVVGSKMALDGHFAYVADGHGGLTTINLFPHYAPMVVDMDENYCSNDVAIKDDFLYTFWGSKLRIINLSVPDNPTFLKDMDLTHVGKHLIVEGNILCIVSHYYWYPTFKLYDVSDPENPELLSTRRVDQCWSGDIQGSYLYLNCINGEGIQVWDISNPSDPLHLATNLESGSPHATKAAGDLLFVSDYYGDGFKIFDISLPAEIHLVSSLPLEYSEVPCWEKDGIVYNCGGNMVQVIDVHDPHNPLFLGVVGNNRQYMDIAITGDKILALGYDGDLDLSMIQCNGPTAVYPEIPRQPENFLTVFPNPFNPQTTLSWENRHQQRIIIEVYDLAGRLVSTLATRVFPIGACTFEWNGSGKGGTDLVSGVYLVSLRGEFFNTSQRVCLIR